MLPFNISDRQYVLPLDSLDLCLLSQYIQRPTNEKRVLWSKPSMDGELVYCEIPAPSDEIQDEDSCIVPSETYVCHICNIDVPQLYFKQHNKSRQHENYKRLVEKALQNVFKQINIDVDSIDNCDRQDEYYCETCSKVILVKNKYHHNKSTYHSKAIENQKLAVNFIEKYLGDSKADNEDVNTETASNRSNIKYNNESDTDWNFDSECENESVTNINQVFPNAISTTEGAPNKTTDSSSSNSGFNTSQLVETPETLIENAGPSSSRVSITNKVKTPEILNRNAGCSSSKALNTRKEMINFQTYLKEMMVKHKLNFDMPIIEGNCVVIVTPNGNREKISVDAFHGYEINVTKGIFCFSCRKVVNPNKNEHSKTRAHLKNMMKPIDDNFTRETASSDMWRYCLICNIAVAVTDNCTHARRGICHKVVTSNATTIIHDGTVKKKFCDVCQRYIDIKKFSIHIKSKTHERKSIANNARPVAPVVNIDSSRVAPFNMLPSQSNTDTYCDICEVHVPLGGMAVHVNGRRHKMNCNNVRRANEGIESNSQTTEDNTLRNDLPSTSAANPSTLPPQSKKASGRTKKLVEYKKQMAELNIKEVQCMICNIRVSNAANNIITHAEGAKHRAAVKLLLNQNQIVKNNDRYFCQRCNTFLDDFVLHINRQCS